MSLASLNERFAKMHSGNVAAIDQALDKQYRGVAVSVEDPAAPHLAKIPLELLYLLPDSAEPDFEETGDPMTKFFGDLSLEAFTGNRPAQISEANFEFAKLLEIDVADQEFLLSRGAVTLANGAGEPLEKSASALRESLFAYVQRTLAKGITREEILAAIHSGGAEPETISLVEEAVRALAA
jgi:hypothetical protein